MIGGTSGATQITTIDHFMSSGNTVFGGFSEATEVVGTTNSLPFLGMLNS